MTQDAVVIKAFDNGLAEVLVARGTSCGEHCGSCSVCKYVGEIHTYAKNKIHAAAGDKVVIATFIGTDVKLDGVDYKFVKQDDILAVVTD